MSVAVRLRPMNSMELECKSSTAVKRTPDGLPHVSVDFHESFAFNYVFDQRDTQKDLFEACVQTRLKRLLQGFDVTILAYGQKGCGKTYTMGTDFNGVMDDKVGLIPRAVHYLFQYISTLKKSYTFRVSCSFVKIYQEELFDLLLPRNNLSSRLAGPGLTELEVSSAQEVTDHLMRGFAKRAVGEKPSESHSILTLTLVARKLGGGGPTSETTTKLNFVDLAASGCWIFGNDADRSKGGLVALGNVLNTLAYGEIAPEYIPYGQSLLTSLLQDSLGGRSIRLLIACVSSSDANVSETMRTLRFADRTLPVMKKPGLRLDQRLRLVSRLKDIIQQLSGELLRAIQAVAKPDDRQRLEDRAKNLEKKNLKLHQELEQILIDTADADVRGGILAKHIVQSKTHVRRIMTMLGLQRQQEPGPQSVQSEGNQLLQTLVELNRIVSDTTGQLRARDNLYLQTHSQQSWQQFNNGGGDFGLEANAAGPEDHVSTQQQGNDEYYYDSA
ncbi:kinesin-related protein 8 [Drosophila persimilis]|uniref:kinesin-related protein 8 n=1 Tax=Drosophila persimilis TaxID=7234 RepID=UPI000F08A842|nr:kinesin-related protein 8 [Drosophila persimilis]